MYCSEILRGMRDQVAWFAVERKEKEKLRMRMRMSVPLAIIEQDEMNANHDCVACLLGWLAGWLVGYYKIVVIIK